MKTTGLIKQEWTILAALALFALVFRLLTLMPIHSGVDERDYWNSAKAITQGTEYPPLTHRTVRVSVIWPTAALQQVFGTGANVYYLGPLINSMVQAALAFLLGKKLRGTLTGVLAGSAMVLFPYMIRAGSQVRPEIYSMTYILAALYCLVSYARRDTGEWKSLACISVWLFLAYEAKVTNLFFLPGIAAGIAMLKHKWKHMFFMGGLLFGFYLIETAIYYMATDYPLGQLQVILGSHLADDVPGAVVNGFFDLFKRYTKPYLQVYWQLPFLAFGAASLYYLSRKNNRELKALIVVCISFFFFLTFAVKDLSPVTPAEDFINRYFCAVLAPVFLVLSALAQDLAEGLGKRSLEPRASLVGLAVLVAILSMAGFMAMDTRALHIRGFGASPLRLSEHPLVQNKRFKVLINEAYAAGHPIVAYATNGGRNALAACESYFLEKQNLGTYGMAVVSRVSSSSGQEFFAWGHAAMNLPLAGSVLATVRNPHRLKVVQVEDLEKLTGERFPGESRRGTDTND